MPTLSLNRLQADALRRTILTSDFLDQVDGLKEMAEDTEVSFSRVAAGVFRLNHRAEALQQLGWEDEITAERIHFDTTLPWVKERTRVTLDREADLLSSLATKLLRKNTGLAAVRQILDSVNAIVALLESLEQLEDERDED